MVKCECPSCNEIITGRNQRLCPTHAKMIRSWQIACRRADILNKLRPQIPFIYEVNEREMKPATCQKCGITFLRKRSDIIICERCIKGSECKVEGCHGKVHMTGYCLDHYKEYRNMTGVMAKLVDDGLDAVIRYLDTIASTIIKLKLNRDDLITFAKSIFDNRNKAINDQKTRMKVSIAKETVAAKQKEEEIDTDLSKFPTADELRTKAESRAKVELIEIKKDLISASERGEMFIVRKISQGMMGVYKTYITKYLELQKLKVEVVDNEMIISFEQQQ